MPPTLIELRVDATRRLLRWSLVSGGFGLVVVVVALVAHAPRKSLMIYLVAGAISWLNAAIQFRSYKAALAARPSGEA
jgi:hypothetical protein